MNLIGPSSIHHLADQQIEEHETMCASKQTPLVDPRERRGRGEAEPKSLSNEGDTSIDLRSACCITAAAPEDLESGGGCNSEGGL